MIAPESKGASNGEPPSENERRNELEGRREGTDLSTCPSALLLPPPPPGDFSNPSFVASSGTLGYRRRVSGGGECEGLCSCGGEESAPRRDEVLRARESSKEGRQVSERVYTGIFALETESSSISSLSLSRKTEREGAFLEGRDEGRHSRVIVSRGGHDFLPSTRRRRFAGS